MSKRYSSNHIKRVLELLGFSFICQRGSHAKFKNEQGRTVILPMNRREIQIGTFRSILRQAGINENAFKKFD
jgi:predicted RNA binding protein YcfA (HicA-like mRNA interferase family)